MKKKKSAFKRGKQQEIFRCEMRVDADHFRHSWISRERYGDEEGTSLHNKLYFRSDSFTGTRLCTFMLAVYAAH